MSVTFAQYGDWDDRGDMRWPRHDRIIQEYYHLECEVLDTPAFPVRLMKSLDVDENEEAFVCLEKGTGSTLL